MKMNLYLTNAEGRAVVDALREVAVKKGWNSDCEPIVEEYCAAVDAALAAMGFSVEISNEPENQTEEDDAPDCADECASYPDCEGCSYDEEWEEDEEGGYFNHEEEDCDEDTDENPSHLTDDEKEMGLRIFKKVQEDMPDAPFEEQVRLAAAIATAICCIGE